MSRPLEDFGSRTVASQRATTSSRHPGRVFRGTVYTRLHRLVKCEACGGLYLPYGPPGAPHAARWAKTSWAPGEQPYKVDCIGRRVP